MTTMMMMRMMKLYITKVKVSNRRAVNMASCIVHNYAEMSSGSPPIANALRKRTSQGECILL